MNELKKIIWLCQAGFLFDVGGKRIAVDPYLTNSCVRLNKGLDRMMPVPISAEQLKPDYVFFSHDHQDHFDAESVASLYKLYKDCFFAGPDSTNTHFKRMKLDGLRFQTLIKNCEFDFKYFSVKPVVAHHSDPLALGYVFDFDGRKIYFSGDTEYSSALSYEVLKAANGKVDMVFVVINGKGGNMNWHEAVKLVAELKPRQAVPMHYGLFPANTENPNPFKKEVEKLSIKCVLPQAGKELDFS